MAKIVIKSQNITSFGGIFPIMEFFTSKLSNVIDNTLGKRSNLQGYQYSEIIRSLMCVYFCGGSCVEDITKHLLQHLSRHPTLRTCSSDTILRAINELTTKNEKYTSECGNSYNFNTADLLNKLLINSLISTKALCPEEQYDVDFDHQFIHTEKSDTLLTYKHFLGYRVAAAVIGDKIVGIENADGNTNVRFHQADTLHRFFTRLEEAGISVDRFRADCGSCSKDIVSEIEKHSQRFYIRSNRCESLYNDMINLQDWTTERINGIDFELNSMHVEKWEGKTYRLVVQRQKRINGELDIWEGQYTYRCILTNDESSSAREIVVYYNLRGGKERIFDEMNNGFGWKHLPKSKMEENAVFLAITALIYNFFKIVMKTLDVKSFGLKATNRIKTFIFKFVEVPAKWIRTSRQCVLNIYSNNTAYETALQTDFG